MGNYNNTGILKKEAGPTQTKAEASSPDPKPNPAQIEALDALQMLLDIVGLIPGAGAPADVLNGIISAARGDFIGAALSIFGVIPIAGEAATVGKIAKNSEKYMQALEVVAQKVIPKLPASVRGKVEEALAAARKKLDEISGKKPPPPPPPPAPPPAPPPPGKKVKGPKPKPKCGQAGPYKDRNDHDNTGVNWDHVPSKAALFKAAEKLLGRDLKPHEITAIAENAPTIAIPDKLHQQQSETYGGRQNQTIEGDKRIEHDSKDLSKAAKSNTDKISSEIDKYDPGCKGAYAKAASEITKRTNKQWDDWLEDIVESAGK